MKRLFLLIAVCMIGMVLPQGMWAETYSGNGVEIVVEGKTVTINSNNAGALSSYLNSGNASAAIAAIQAANGDGSSIVFDGKFNSDDLSKLNENNCCVQKKVDMAEAKFIKSGGSSTEIKLYNSNLPQSGNDGDRCIVNGCKYESATNDGNNYFWREVSYQDGSNLDNNVERFATLPEAGAATSQWRALLVGGTEYVYSNGGWDTAGGNDEYDYTQMKFDNWKTQ